MLERDYKSVNPLETNLKSIDGFIYEMFEYKLVVASIFVYVKSDQLSTNVSLV